MFFLAKRLNLRCHDQSSRAIWSIPIAQTKGAFSAISRILKDGSYELKVPFFDDRELIMDILKYGADCEVVSPGALREKVAAEISQAGMRYQT